MTCQLLKDKVGYKGQKYEVRYKKDSSAREQGVMVFGWQNQKTGGLVDAVKLMPGVSDAYTVRVCPDANGNPVATKEVKK